METPDVLGYFHTGDDSDPSPDLPPCNIFLATVLARLVSIFSQFVVFTCTSVIPFAIAHTIINTSYEKLPFGSGDYPDKLLFHQALN